MLLLYLVKNIPQNWTFQAKIIIVHMLSPDTILFSTMHVSSDGLNRHAY